MRVVHLGDLGKDLSGLKGEAQHAPLPSSASVRLHCGFTFMPGQVSPQDDD